MTEIKNDSKEIISKNIGLNVWERAFWEDIGGIVIRVAVMYNSSYTKISFFMSETGVFYDEDHNMVADDIDHFLEYFLEVSCDSHEQPDARTYQILRDAGWYEGRKTDIDGIIANCLKNGVELTQVQKDIISEFAGIRTERFEIFDKAEGDDFSPHSFKGRLKAETVKIGIYKSAVKLYLSADGRIFKETGTPIGLDHMEAIHLMLKNE